MNEYSCVTGKTYSARSAQEVKIFATLDILGIDYQSECSLPNTGQLSYDVYIPKFNLLIEYDGKQHFEFTPYFHANEKQFISLRERDMIKTVNALQRKISLMRIDHNIQDVSVISSHIVNVLIDLRARDPSGPILYLSSEKLYSDVIVGTYEFFADTVEVCIFPFSHLDKKLNVSKLSIDGVDTKTIRSKTVKQNVVDIPKSQDQTPSVNLHSLLSGETGIVGDPKMKISAITKKTSKKTNVILPDNKTVSPGNTQALITSCPTGNSNQLLGPLHRSWMFYLKSCSVDDGKRLQMNPKILKIMYAEYKPKNCVVGFIQSTSNPCTEDHIIGVLNMGGKLISVEPYQMRWDNAKRFMKQAAYISIEKSVVKHGEIVSIPCGVGSYEVSVHSSGQNNPADSKYNSTINKDVVKLPEQVATIIVTHFIWSFLLRKWTPFDRERLLAEKQVSKILWGERNDNLVVGFIEVDDKPSTRDQIIKILDMKDDFLQIQGYECSIIKARYLLTQMSQRKELRDYGSKL